MSTYPHEAYINNNVDINEIWPKDNNDMMQCVTCNRSSHLHHTQKDKFSKYIWNGRH
jgi:hypothetical protein